MSLYYEKYLKYKSKYINLKNQYGGTNNPELEKKYTEYIDSIDKFIENNDVFSLQEILDQFEVMFGSSGNRTRFNNRPVLQNILKKAIQKGNLDIVKALTNFGITADYATLFACLNNFEKINEDILTTITNENSVELLSNNIFDSTNLTLLMSFVIKNNLRVCKFLIENGANINASDSNRKTVLMYAAEGGNQEIFNSLLGKGANMEAVDNNGKTVLMYAKDDNFKEYLKSKLPEKTILSNLKKMIGIKK